jgi:CheY-like chemotaxis protein
MKSPSLLRENVTNTIPAALMDRQAIARLLVVDDEPNVQYSLKKSLQSDWLQVVTASTGGEGIDLVRNQHLDAVILDVRLPDMSGLDAFDEIRRIDSRLPVIILTAYGTTETAIEAMKRGAFEYLLKPADFRQLRSLVGKAVEISHLRRVPAVIAEDDPANDDSVDRIIGETPAMREVYKAIGRVAPLYVPVLIQGESASKFASCEFDFPVNAFASLRHTLGRLHDLAHTLPLFAPANYPHPSLPHSLPHCRNATWLVVSPLR